MELGGQPRNIYLQLLVLVCLLYICASQSCTFSSECPAFAKCSWGRCSCKYGLSSYDASGRLRPCQDHCTFDSDCVAFADCNWSFSPGNRCECRYGGSSSYVGDDAVSCDAPTGLIIGSIIGSIAFLAIIIACCCVVTRRRRLARANQVTVCIQPAVVQRIPVNSNTYQPVYPVHQYQQTAPPYPGYNNAGYGSCQPPPYNEVSSK